MVRQITKFFLSIRTTIWLLWFLMAVLFAGAFIMPAKEEFQAIHSMPLFDWLKEQPISMTWWLWCSIIILAILTINTVFCSIESIIKKRKATQWLLLISPQIIHIGFLFMLLAHLLSSIGGFKGVAVAREGAFLKMPDDDITLNVKAINIDVDQYGYINDWEVNVEYISGQNKILKDRIKPNAPSLKEGFNINVKDLQAFPEKAVLLQVSREPGALWALIGGILFMAGIIILIVLKVKMEK
jgi:cytochrome c biogenesis protein ResB